VGHPHCLFSRIRLRSSYLALGVATYECWLRPDTCWLGRSFCWRMFSRLAASFAGADARLNWPAGPHVPDLPGRAFKLKPKSGEPAGVWIFYLRTKGGGAGGVGCKWVGWGHSGWLGGCLGAIIAAQGGSMRTTNFFVMGHSRQIPVWLELSLSFSCPLVGITPCHLNDPLVTCCGPLAGDNSGR